MDCQGRTNGRQGRRSTGRSRNRWLLQEVNTRLPGRLDSHDTTFTSAGELAIALRRAQAAHVQHEQRTGQRDADWSDWYSDYLVSEQAGTPLPP
jgi:hypothetical protein